MRHTMSGANRSVMGPVPCCQASKARRTAARLASVSVSVALLVGSLIGPRLRR